jgi:hypothetical protein
MFRLQDPSVQSGNGSSNSSGSSSVAPGIPRNAGIGLSSRRPLMQFAQMNMRGLPQGDMAKEGGNSSSGSGSRGGVQSWRAAASVGGSSWVSALPAEAYTHLLWFVTR